MPLDKLIAVGLPIALGVVMIGAGAFNFIGPRSIHESLARWGIPPFSSGDGRARNDGRVAAADPGDLARRRDRQRRDPAGCGDDPHPLSRLDTLAWRHRADSGGSSGGYDPRIAAATSSSTRSRSPDGHALANAAAPLNGRRWRRSEGEHCSIDSRSAFHLSRRKKNPSAISRSRSLASSAERRRELGSRGGVSNTASRMRGAEVPSLPARAKANRSSA